MADPLSLIASVIAVAEFTAKSCECLYKTAKRFSEADDELKDHVAVVRSLCAIFSNIATLRKKYPNVDSLLSDDFDIRLQTCLQELQSMTNYAQSFIAQLEKGRARRTWAKVRWSSVDHRQRMGKQLDRIELHCRTFTLDLVMLNV